MLSDHDIIQCRKEGLIHFDSFNESALNPNSYDLRLGNYFYYLSWASGSPRFYGPIEIDTGGRVYIPLNGTLLGMTKEIVGTEKVLSAKLRAKNTIRRLGISVSSSAGWGDVGYINHWTVMLTAHTDGNPYLAVGSKFCQIIFDWVSSRPDNPYEGQYSSTDWPECMVPSDYRNNIIPASQSLTAKVRMGWHVNAVKEES
jgi:deoxycytidine triphosphate deaminase